MYHYISPYSSPVLTSHSYLSMTSIADDEPDEWDKRILNTGCYEENLALQLCHADKGDWRKCLGEMAAFRKCWDQNKNNARTSTVDNPSDNPNDKASN